MTTKYHYVLIGIGSNLNKPYLQLNKAIEQLNDTKSIRLVTQSSIYQNPALILKQQETQPDFLNTVVLIKTSLNSSLLLAELNHIEDKQQRIRQVKWQARTVDLDILFFGTQNISNKKLTIPHYDLYNRSFFVYPTIEIIDHIGQEQFIHYFGEIFYLNLIKAKQKLDEITDFDKFILLK